MGLYRMGPPEDLILALQARLRLGDFVETGTYRGDTAAWAAEHFARVTTIELSPAYCAASIETCAINCASDAISALAAPRNPSSNGAAFNSASIAEASAALTGAGR